MEEAAKAARCLSASGALLAEESTDSESEGEVERGKKNVGKTWSKQEEVESESEEEIDMKDMKDEEERVVMPVVTSLPASSATEPLSSKVNKKKKERSSVDDIFAAVGTKPQSKAATVDSPMPQKKKQKTTVAASGVSVTSTSLDSVTKPATVRVQLATSIVGKDLRDAPSTASAAVSSGESGKPKTKTKKSLDDIFGTIAGAARGQSSSASEQPPKVKKSKDADDGLKSIVNKSSKDEKSGKKKSKKALDDIFGGL